MTRLTECHAGPGDDGVSLGVTTVACRADTMAVRTGLGGAELTVGDGVHHQRID